MTNINDIDEIEIPFGTYDVVDNNMNRKIINAEIKKERFRNYLFFENPRN